MDEQTILEVYEISEHTMIWIRWFFNDISEASGVSVANNPCRCIAFTLVMFYYKKKLHSLAHQLATEVAESYKETTYVSDHS